MAKKYLLGLIEGYDRNSADQWFRFEIECSGELTPVIPKEAANIVWSKYEKPSFVMLIKRQVPGSGVVFRAVRIDKEISESEAIRIKNKILYDHPEVNSFEIYVIKSNKYFMICQLSQKNFNVLHSVPEYEKYQQYRYSVDSIPVFKKEVKNV